MIGDLHMLAPYRTTNRIEFAAFASTQPDADKSRLQRDEIKWRLSQWINKQLWLTPVFPFPAEATAPAKTIAPSWADGFQRQKGHGMILDMSRKRRCSPQDKALDQAPMLATGPTFSEPRIEDHRSQSKSYRL